MTDFKININPFGQNKLPTNISFQPEMFSKRFSRLIGCREWNYTKLKLNAYAGKRIFRSTCDDAASAA